ncbi:MAG: hypothetical protein KGZ25_09225 [Planctomycetes bacterium]|nr:hypothetical protein [Planctomycetota bacterium]
MFVHVHMQRIRIIVLKRQVDVVTETLGRLGAVELSQAEEGQEGREVREELGQRAERCEELKRRLEKAMDRLEIDHEGLTESEGRRKPVGLDGIERLVGDIESRIQPVEDALKNLEEEIAQAKDVMDRVLPYRDLEVSPQELSETSFLHVTAGDMPAKRISGAQNELPDDAVLVSIGEPVKPEGGSATVHRVLALSSRRSRFALRTILEDYQFEEQKLPRDYEAAPAAIYDRAREERDELKEQREEMQEPLRELGETNAAELRAAYRSVIRQLRISQAEQKYGSTWATAIITGWCPEEQIGRVRNAIDRVTDGNAICETREATEEEIDSGKVPTYTRLPGWLQPFQRLVQGFGVPGYEEIEPTILFAVSFLLMFGVIFGDLGHGLCLLAIGIVTYKIADRAEVQDVGFVIGCAGVGSALFGTFFQGSFFGKSLTEMGWPLTLGLEPINFEGETGGAADQVLRYMLIAVGFGVALISLGVLLNIISRLRAGEYEQGFLGRFGITGMVFYWGTLGTIVKIAVVGKGPLDLYMILGFILVPLLVLALHQPILILLGKGAEGGESAVVGLFEGVVEALETVMTFLANTFSFLRVAAFALSHVALCFTICILQKPIQELPASPIWAALIFVAGTAVIIGLEGLIVAIQIFRLEYYEFFTKFFRGDGHKYSPFQLEQNQ